MSHADKATATLRLPSTLSAYSGGKSQITVEAETVEQLLNALHKKHPQVWEKLCTEQGSIREHVRIFVNNQLISGDEGLKTVLMPGQEVIVLPTTFNV
ncbi:thiamine biosynthesis protein ThiS [Dictyobacter alpinus]|uniref:Thiamine biosynthesis protein ThiS n=1 Tax=Dictyobacter alpinus TaxID=2014873 RepID=A0A402B021_9CHLR|nr:MoaD/ThiS family protein [Dictyobacter alpinus]GCE24694.1 thiamine biosynthesis protein ThiS [Dictyobacter alpinus]